MVPNQLIFKVPVKLFILTIFPAYSWDDSYDLESEKNFP